MRHPSTLLVVGLFSLAACGLDEQEFRDALPSERAVTIQAPDRGDALALTAGTDGLGAQSKLYRDTRAITRDVNGGIRMFLELIKQIVSTPATSAEDERLVWGPGADALDPVIYRLVAKKQDEGKFTYALQYRPKGSADDEANYVNLVEGHSDVSSGEGDGVGGITLHAGVWADVEPGSCARGSIVAEYDTTTEPEFLAVTFEGFSDVCPDQGSDAQVLAYATYYYERHADGSGNFQFSVVADVDHGSVLAGESEVLAIRSRWLATGAGRSDVRVYGGDIQENWGITQATASECWDELFSLTYSDVEPIAIDPSKADLGEPSACASGFEAPEYATELEQ